MGRSSTIVIIVVILAVSDAFIEFEKSRIYDEKDFEGTDTIYLPNYCSPGCQIYVSIPDKSTEIARKLFIYEGGDRTSLVDANSKDEEGHIQPYIVKEGTAQVDLLNENDRHKSAPIAVWIVRGDAPLINNVEVYEADDVPRKLPWTGIITVISTDLFGVTTGTDGPMTVSAYTAGFDAFESADKCTRVLRQDDPFIYQDVQIAVRSPLITFFFDVSQFPDTNITLQATKSHDTQFDLDKPMFVTSPGYIGCSVKTGQPVEGGVRTKTFRSSLYDSKTKFKFKSHDPMSIVLSSDLNIDDDHPVEINADKQPTIKWSGMNASPSINLNARELQFAWTMKAKDMDVDQYFMIRVEQEPSSIVKTTTVDGFQTTTDESLNTTTELPEHEETTTKEPDAARSTSDNADHEHISSSSATTYPQPAPEDVKSTLREIMRATSIDPVYEEITISETQQPEHTSTMEDEPKTTTTLLLKPRRTPPMRPLTSTTTFHPKYTSKSTTTTVSTMTTSGATYGSLLLPIALVSILYFV